MVGIRSQNKKAFTIIEVVMVLAIAGLIFLVVFQAIPRLQASRRDNQRKRDAEHLFALAQEYQSSTGSVLTRSVMVDAFDGSPGGSFLSYIDGDEFRKPDGGSYEGNNNWAYHDLNPGHFIYYDGRECAVNGTRVSGLTSPNDMVLVMSLERGAYCIDSN